MINYKDFKLQNKKNLTNINKKKMRSLKGMEKNMKKQRLLHLFKSQKKLLKRQNSYQFKMSKSQLLNNPPKFKSQKNNNKKIKPKKLLIRFKNRHKFYLSLSRHPSLSQDNLNNRYISLIKIIKISSVLQIPVPKEGTLIDGRYKVLHTEVKTIQGISNQIVSPQV